MTTRRGVRVRLTIERSQSASYATGNLPMASTMLTPVSRLLLQPLVQRPLLPPLPLPPP